MSLLDTASLIVTPNGYEEGKLFSVIPSDGSGDMSAVRATTATRVNSAGLVELVPYNLLEQSNSFNGSPWAAVATRTPNAAIAPDGTMTATRIQLASGGISYLYQGVPFSSGAKTISCYIKGATAQTIGFNDGNANPNSINITTEWQRYTFTFNSNSVGMGIQFDNYFGVSPSNQAKDFYIWGAQFVEGSTAKDYQKTETRLNIPRLDYSNGTCPSLLVEPQRTNRLIYSEELVVGKAFAYASGTFSVTQNTTDTLDPFGNNNAEKFTAVDQAANDSYTATSGSGNITLSVFAKKGTSNTLVIYHDNVTIPGFFWAQFNIQTGVVLATNGAVVSTSVEDYGNGWFRCSVTGPDTNATGNIHNFTTYAGTSYLFGVQLEQGNYPTSYIPTQGASVTRNADVISKTGISSLIGQTEGTLFYDGYFGNNSSEVYIFLQASGSGGVDNSIYLQKNANPTIGVKVFSGPTQIANINGGSFSVGDRIKIAAAYKANDFVLYINGTQIGTDTSGTPPTCANFNLGNYAGAPTNEDFLLNKGVNAAALWQTRLDNATLAQLTTI